MSIEKYSLQSGVTMLPVAIIIAVVGSIAYLISNQTTFNVNSVSAYSEDTYTDYVAQAGLQHALWTANKSGCSNYAMVDTAFGAHSYNAVFAPTDESPVNITVTGTLANGNTRSITRNNVPIYDYTSPATIILQPGSEGKDSFIEGQSSHTDHNKENDNHLRINSQSTKEDRILIQFDLSTLPSTAIIESASLELNVSNNKGLASTIEVYRITRDWTEDGVTWESYNGTNDWSTAGGDYDPQLINSFLIDSVGPKTVDLSVITQAWVDQSIPNYGIIMVSPSTSTNSEKKIDSSDNPSTVTRPKLTINYYCECSTICSGLSPGYELLFSTDGPAELAGLSFDDIDIVKFDASTSSASLVFEGASTSLDRDIDALHVLPNGNIVFSTKDDASLAGLNFSDDDLVEYDPVALTASMYFDGSLHFSNADEDIISVHIRENGNLILSTENNAQLGGLSFSDRDLIEYNPTTMTASIFFDGDATSLSQDITGVHVLESGMLVLAVKNNTTLGGIDISEADLIQYDIDSDSATLYFEGSGLFSDANEKIISVFVKEPVIDVNELLGHWKLDEISGINAEDSAGEYDGTLNNGPVWEPGVFEGGLSFDGNDDYIDLSVMNPQSYDDFTITSWYRSAESTVSDDEYIFVHVDSSDYAYGFTFGPTDDSAGNETLRLATYASEVSDRHYGTTDIVDQQWHHLAAVRQDGRIKLYVDGVEESDAVDAHAGLTIAVNGDGPFIGDYPDESEPVHGTVDDVRFYGRALSSEEIAELAQIPLPDPVAHWKFDDGTGLTAVDSLSGHDGVLENGPQWTTEGQIDGALDFDGFNDQVIVPHDESLASFSALTISAWIQNQSTFFGSAHRIISKESNGQNNNFWLALSGQYLYLGIGGSFFTPSTVFSPDQWYHVVATFDDDANMVRIFVDGVEVYTQSTSASLSTNTADIVIGSNWENKAWDGLLDDVRLYDQALTSEEIAALYNMGAGQGESPPPIPGCSDTLRDEFNAREYEGNDGSVSWSTDWLEVGESDGPTSGDERVISDLGHSYVLRVRDNNNGGEGVQREGDLSAYTSATLNFDYSRNSLDNSNDYVTIDVSNNGGSTWTELTRLQGPGTDSSYFSMSHDISSFISSNTRIRFLTSPTMGNTDEVYFDNVEISVSGCAE